jgi:hypothetical protein
MTLVAGVLAFIAGALAYKAASGAHHNLQLAYRRHVTTMLQKFEGHAALALNAVVAMTPSKGYEYDALSLKDCINEYIGMFNTSKWQENALLPERTRVSIQDGFSKARMVEMYLIAWENAARNKSKQMVRVNLKDGTLSDVKHHYVDIDPRVVNEYVDSLEVLCDVLRTQLASLGLVGRWDNLFNGRTFMQEVHHIAKTYRIIQRKSARETK